MSPFQGLIMKDYRISQGLFLTSLVIFLFFMVFGFGLSAYLKEPAGTLPVIVISALAITIFSPIMMLSMLKIEGKVSYGFIVQGQARSSYFQNSLSFFLTNL